jgi:tetratricopeptide (TPR) repeat protein
VAVFGLVVATTPALGSNRRAQEKAARKACLTGDYDKGVAILADLFVETRQPVYLYNQGRCFEQNRRYEEAIARFEEYLRTGETTALKSDDRAAAEKHIADCRSHLPEDSSKAQAAAPPSFVPPPPSAAPIPEPAPTPEPAAELVEQPKPQPEPPKGRSGLLTAGIIVGAIGVAAVGVGVGFNVKANSMVTDMETKVDNYSANNESSQKTYKTLAWVGYLGGAALVATGVVFVAVGATSRRRSSSNVALVPAVGPDRAGLLLSGAF